MARKVFASHFQRYHAPPKAENTNMGMIEKTMACSSLRAHNTNQQSKSRDAQRRAERHQHGC